MLRMGNISVNVPLNLKVMAGSQASKHDVIGFAPKLQQYAPLNSDGKKI